MKNTLKGLKILIGLALIMFVGLFLIPIFIMEQIGACILGNNKSPILDGWGKICVFLTGVK